MLEYLHSTRPNGSLKGLLANFFYWLEICPCPLINVSYVKNLTTCYKEIGKCILSDFWDLIIVYQMRKWLLKRNYRMEIPLSKLLYQMWIWLSKSLTKRESGHQIFLPDIICLSGKIYDFFIRHGAGGGKSRTYYVICAHSLCHEPWVQCLDLLKFSSLLYRLIDLFYWNCLYYWGTSDKNQS